MPTHFLQRKFILPILYKINENYASGNMNFLCGVGILDTFYLVGSVFFSGCRHHLKNGRCGRADAESRPGGMLECNKYAVVIGEEDAYPSKIKIGLGGTRWLRYTGSFEWGQRHTRTCPILKWIGYVAP